MLDTGVSRVSTAHSVANNDTRCANAQTLVQQFACIARKCGEKVQLLQEDMRILQSADRQVLQLLGNCR